LHRGESRVIIDTVMGKATEFVKIEPIAITGIGPTLQIWIKYSKCKILPDIMGSAPMMSMRAVQNVNTDVYRTDPEVYTEMRYAKERATYNRTAQK